jgi:hypothetical protein
MSAVVEPQELSGDEFRALLEERLRETLAMTLEEFAEGLAEGRLDPESPEVAGLAILVAPRTR